MKKLSHGIHLHLINNVMYNDYHFQKKLGYSYDKLVLQDFNKSFADNNVGLAFLPFNTEMDILIMLCRRHCSNVLARPRSGEDWQKRTWATIICGTESLTRLNNATQYISTVRRV